MKTVQKSAKLANVCYDIRGPIMDAAKKMEDDGQKIIKLNIGNLAVFGFDAPEEVQQDMIRCGRLPPACPAARPCITCATSPMAGCPIWTTSAPRSRRAPRASSSSTPTTLRVRCTPGSCCCRSWSWRASMAWSSSRTRSTTRCCTRMPSTRRWAACPSMC